MIELTDRLSFNKNLSVLEHGLDDITAFLRQLGENKGQQGIFFIDGKGIDFLLDGGMAFFWFLHCFLRGI